MTHHSMFWPVSGVQGASMPVPLHACLACRTCSSTGGSIFGDCSSRLYSNLSLFFLDDLFHLSIEAIMSS